jgi:tRNA (adenine22-N1)-methyltransferase
MQISKRLEAVASLVSSGCKVADIGTDHAYIPIELVSSKRIPCAIAMDVNKGPLERAVEHIRQYGLEVQIETRLSDGLAALRSGEAESIVIAGMGGPLTVRILQDGEEKLSGCRELILQPQSELGQVRSYIEQKGWTISQEEMVLEDGKYYPMMKVLTDEDRKHPAMTATQLRYGPLLLQNHHPVLHEFLKKEQKVKKQILQSLSGQDTEAARVRRQEVQEDLSMIEEALSGFENA